MATTCLAIQQKLSDWKLIVVVVALVVVDLVILLVYTIVEGTMGNLEARRIANRENPTEEIGVSPELSDNILNSFHSLSVMCVH